MDDINWESAGVDILKLISKYHYLLNITDRFRDIPLSEYGRTYSNTEEIKNKYIKIVEDVIFFSVNIYPNFINLFKYEKILCYFYQDCEMKIVFNPTKEIIQYNGEYVTPVELLNDIASKYQKKLNLDPTYMYPNEWLDAATRWEKMITFYIPEL